MFNLKANNEFVDERSLHGVDVDGNTSRVDPQRCEQGRLHRGAPVVAMNETTVDEVTSSQGYDGTSRGGRECPVGQTTAV